MSSQRDEASDERFANNTYTQAVLHASQNVEVAVGWSNPSRPAEIGEDGEDVVGEPEVYKHSAEGVHEELESRHGPHLLEGTHNGVVLLIMQCSVEGNGHKRHWPHAVGWVDKELSGQASKTVSNKVGRKAVEEHVSKIARILLVEVLRQNLCPDNIVGVR